MKYVTSYDSQTPRSRGNSYLFVLSHMRSFSSLLAHILGSHADISGYTETQQSYFGRTDLNALRRKVQKITGDSDGHRYVLDKILHNEFHIGSSILARPDVKTLFLVRRPEETITSIVNMRNIRARTVEQAAGYYVARLQQLQSYSLLPEVDALFIAAERLIDDTDAVLDGLSRWLELDEPLSAKYKTFQWTGVAGYGDPSPNIKVGSVVTDAEKRLSAQDSVDIPQDVLRQANEGYAACREIMLRSHSVP